MRSEFRPMLFAAGGILAIAALSYAQALSGTALVTALRQGGYVIVMRHASSPSATPDKRTAKPDNVNMERQLDEVGRNSATAMGKAVRDLKIPIGEVSSSPAYRTLETVKYARLGSAQLHAELGDLGKSMQGVSDADGAWLRERAAQVPKRGNTIIVTHSPNLARAFPQAASVAEGEALIFHPDGKGVAALVARVRIEEWPALRP